ncbi:hypothetical protein UlMin_041222 [Ulmus minor]
MEACLMRCSNGGSFLSALKPHHFKLPNFLRCSSSPSSMSIHSDGLGSVRRAYDGLLLDAGGTLLQLAKPVEETYASIGSKYVKVAVVSNFDTRLRKLLKDLNVLDLFDAIIISSEIGYEKPDPKIFEAALDQISVEAGKAVHVGDDKKADKVGANAVGIDCWLWGVDVKTFSDIQKGILISEP